MTWADGALLVAGTSNEEFSSRLRRIASPFEGAADDRSEFVTGQSIAVDGGLTSVSNRDMGAVVGQAFAAMGAADVDPNFSSAAKRDSER